MVRKESTDVIMVINITIACIGSVNFFDASVHDLTALMLLIYFKRDLSVEDLSEFLDPGLLMQALAAKLRNNQMSR